MDMPRFVYPSISNGHLYSFHFGVVMNNVAMKTVGVLMGFAIYSVSFNSQMIDLRCEPMSV
jgi:hypothetical protein